MMNWAIDPSKPCFP